MHGKEDLPENKGSICYIPIETANMCNILPRSADIVTYGLTVIKLKRDLKYRGYIILSQYTQMSYTRY